MTDAQFGRWLCETSLVFDWVSIFRNAVCQTRTERLQHELHAAKYNVSFILSFMFMQNVAVAYVD